MREAVEKYRQKISIKIASYFLIIAIIPPVIISSVLISSARDALHSSIANKQQVYTANVARHINDYLDKTSDNLKLVAQFYITNHKDMRNSLISLFDENPSLTKVEFLTQDDIRQTALRQGDTINIATTTVGSDDITLDMPSSKTKQIILTKDINNRNLITISQPITEKSWPKDHVVGLVTGYYEIGNEWNTILPISDENDAQAYVVDRSGNLVYHPDSNFFSTNSEVKDVEAVQNFLNGHTKTERTVSRSGRDVLSTSYKTEIGWGVIVEEPVGSAYAAIDSYIRLSIIFSIGIIVAAAFIGLLFGGRFVKPFQKIVTGARKLARNDFSASPITIKTKDELQELADILNNIGTSTSQFVANLEAKNRYLTFEQSRLQNIINSVNDGVVAVNGNGEIISINGAAMRLASHVRYDVQGRLIDEIFPWTHEGNPLKLDLVTPGFHTYNDVVLAKNESVAYMDLVVEVADREDSDVAAIITIHDQTSTRELSFMKLDFVAIAAHELRTPLTVISGYLDILNREAIHNLSTENIEDLQKAILGTQQLRELINRLLNIARIDRGDMELFLDKVNLTELVATNVEQHQPVAAQKNQILSFTSTTNDIVYVPADASALSEVLNNLIGNAIKYTPTGGQIRVNIITHGNEVQVEVIDNGPGIPESLRDKLFSKFYRAERSMISGTRGTGLGLFISKTIIELHHGTINIRPDEGRGSTFYFTLPIYKPERDDALITQNISRGKHGWFKKRTTH